MGFNAFATKFAKIQGIREVKEHKTVLMADAAERPGETDRPRAECPLKAREPAGRFSGRPENFTKYS
jgi:hypothetical protein